MVGPILGLSSALLLPALPAGAPADRGEDSCVACHGNPRFLVTEKKLFAYFREWESSIHRQEGVGCSDCHGGNPDAADKKGAHEGEVGASGKRSAVNFENIPATCGECHEEIYQGYRQSRHFEHLVSSEEEAQGPNCVTCHGSINSAALNVNTVKEACQRCHNRDSENHPEIPEKAKLLLNQYLSIHRYYRYIGIRGDPAETREFFRHIDAAIRTLSADWHTFDLEKIEEETWTVLTLMKARRKEVRRQEVERRKP